MTLSSNTKHQPNRTFLTKDYSTRVTSVICRLRSSRSIRSCIWRWYLSCWRANFCRSFIRRTSITAVSKCSQQSSTGLRLKCVNLTCKIATTPVCFSVPYAWPQPVAMHMEQAQLLHSCLCISGPNLARGIFRPAGWSRQEFCRQTVQCHQPLLQVPLAEKPSSAAMVIRDGKYATGWLVPNC